MVTATMVASLRHSPDSHSSLRFCTTSGNGLQAGFNFHSGILSVTDSGRFDRIDVVGYLPGELRNVCSRTREATRNIPPTLTLITGEHRAGLSWVASDLLHR
ncbi:hypothetical protein QC761_201197 [Podospora bellae-mahoneyi]|uniref:Uncharacterized protein n=1 Tax=Podospora bellae-mahoneyi TaxID=2093777 RepID=A0ABR0FR20_9PEZI|nr:hypothetical protein QC761_201197 [Podospora bellae-mahoneyi]